MHLVTVCFGEQLTWYFLYKEATNAEHTVERIERCEQSEILIRDDFGQLAYIRREDIRAYMVEDMELSKLGAVERGLHQARTQATAQKMAATDPVIRSAAAAARAGSGLSTLSPMGQFGPNGPLS